MPSRLDVVRVEEPWYKEGLNFECTGCGQCCTGEPGYVWLSQEEIEKIACYLHLDRDAFLSKYTIAVEGKISLVEDSKKYDCIFLKGNRCEIYPVRPTQCKTFPWWPQHLETGEAWKEAAKRCEGINQEANLVPKTIIDHELNIQQNYRSELENPRTLEPNL